MGRTWDRRKLAWAELLATQKFGGSAETGGRGGAGFGGVEKGSWIGAHCQPEAGGLPGETLGAQVQSSGRVRAKRHLWE